MGTLEKAIEEFIQTRLNVYRADRHEIVRNTHAAESATKDHTGRWLFELLQNSDDAGASEVRVLVEDDAIYVADNGRGLKPEAVNAICGTHWSDKTTGTIGRKGVGFKSVYEVSSNPQVLTVKGEGIEFSPDRAKKWLRQKGLDDGHVPYQWIPFVVSWGKARQQDPVLDSLAHYKTVVRLPRVYPALMRKAQQLLAEWPPHALFAFRHVRQINAPNLQIAVTPGDRIWQMSDSRGETPTSWQVARHTESAPAELLEPLGADERQAIGVDGVSLLIAAPLEKHCLTPTKDYLPVHVFYPTEQKGPVRLLLHAEFLVKSDRTALMPIDGSPFNAWVAERLACRVREFVNGAYRQETPSNHAALLVPFDDRASQPAVTEALWQRIAKEAKAHLRLADVDGHQRLAVGKARVISVSVRRDLARALLEATNVRGRLLHRAFDEDKEARKALKELGCEEVHDQDLMEAIAENAASQASDCEWIWTCWEWLGAWVGKEPYGDKHRERVERVMGLPVVPVDGCLLKPSDLAGRIVTWRSDGQAEDLPDWLPLTLVDDWFRDRIRALTKQEPAVKELCKELGIEEPGADVIQRAAGHAIGQYWKHSRGDPGRFLRFILEQDWHETSVASPALQRCPVPLSQPVQSEAWAEAGKAYFGREWENDLLADLYASIETVAWVANDDADGDKEKRRRVLAWLGVADCPRVIDDPRGQARETGRVVAALPWHTARGEIPTPKALEHVDVTRLHAARTIPLIRLLARHWGTYYSHLSTVSVNYRYYGWYSHSLASAWWEQLATGLLPPLKAWSVTAPLGRCWLPDRRTEQAVGDLLPVINLNAFGNDKDIVREWLVNAASLRTRTEQVTVEEWKELLSTCIPDKACAERLASDERLRDKVTGKVTGWYAACLETVAEQDNTSEKAFAGCPLLCRKGDSWQYVAGEPRYLDDENDLAKAFAGDVWLFNVPVRLTADAVTYFGVLPLSKSVHVHVEAGEPQSALPDELQARFDDSLPYIWAWRSSQSKQDAERLSARLKGLKVHVVPTLKANLDLDGVHHEVERRSHVTADTLFLHTDHANEAELAQALAKAVDVRSEADFYQNLLHCNDADQRKENLLSKGIADAEVERCLREYSRHPEEVKEPPEEEPQRIEKESSSEPPSAGETERQQQQEPARGEQQDQRPVKPPEPPVIREQPVRLKDPQTVDYVIGSPPERGAGPGGGGGGAGGGQEGRSLTDKEKAKLEEAGRRLAERELEKMRYAVEKMPLDNPGFDLRARKGDEELRVEVKAHTGRGNRGGCYATAVRGVPW